MKPFLKKLFKCILFSVLLTVLILGLVYVGLGYYYKDSFSYGTRINGVYCTGHTPAEINDLLNDKYEYNGLIIRTGEGEGAFEYTIRPEDIDFSYDFDSALQIYLHTQNSWLWPLNLTSHKDHILNPIVGFDIAKLNAILDSQDIFCYDEEPDVSIRIQDGDFYLYDNMKHRPDSEAMREAVFEHIYDSDEELILDDSFFNDMDYTDDQLQTIHEYEALKQMLAARITYVLGEDEQVVTEEILDSFILRDDAGERVAADVADETGDGDPYIWSDDAIEAWVDALADRYDTLGSTRAFEATGGYTVKVEGGIYGNQIDRNTEKAYLKMAVRNKLKEDHEPEYLQKALYQGLNDIGNTYIEVNMTDQKLYYYVDGELVIDTPVVTGNMIRHMSTPSGTNYVYYKQRNRTLIGPNYQTFVNYWMAVKGHIGIHDATWRDDFGGDIYMTSGSHGCINTPMDAVSQLYDMVEIGTPVIMYYTE